MYLVQKYLKTSYFLHHSKITLQCTKLKFKNMLFHLSADHYHVSSNSWKSNQHAFGSASLVCTKTSLVVLFLYVEQMMATFISSGIKGCSAVGKQMITIYSFYNWIAVILCHYYAHCINSANKTNLCCCCSLCCFKLLSLLFVPFVSGLDWKSTLFFVLSVNCESANPYQRSRFLGVSSSFAIAGISWMIVLGQTFLYATLQRQ